MNTTTTTTTTPPPLETTAADTDQIGVLLDVSATTSRESRVRDDARSGSESGSSATCERGRPRRWIYRNLTPWRIHACFESDGSLTPRSDSGLPDLAATSVLSIPALGEVTVPAEHASRLDTIRMRRLGQIEVRPAPSELMSSLPQAIVIYGWLVLALVVGTWALFFGGAEAISWSWVVAATVAVPVLALAVATIRELHLYSMFERYRRAVESCPPRHRRRPGGDTLEGVERGSRVRAFVDGVPRQAAEVAVLVGVVAISVIGLGVAIHSTTQLEDLLPIDYAAIFQLDNPFAAVDSVVRSSPAFWQLLVGHIAQWVLVSVAALAPAAMYFQFDRQRLASLQQRWVHDVFRLDPTVRTVRDIEAKYGSQIEAAFGELGPDSGLRLGGGRRSPVIVATILLVVGWFLIIATTQVPELVPGVGGQLVWTGTHPFPVSSFFRPDLTLVGYAFLGAYVFTLFHVVRGYHRRDLHPKTYNTIVVRILAAYALSLVVGVMSDDSGAEVAMFFVGFMPQSALVWLREKVADAGGIGKHIPLHEPAPLTHLEGIDLYDRTRLAEEGINNIEALAHADIVDLMSSTRIPAAALVDWTDQAILYLRVGGDALAQRDACRTGTDGLPSAPDVRANLGHLRSYGIRAASDLRQVYNEALSRGTDKKSRAEEIRSLLAALELPNRPQRSGTPPIQTIIDSLSDEEWFVQVWNWRNSEFGAVDAWYRYLDGHDWTPTEASPPQRIRDAKKAFASVATNEAA